ncbi:hypothetical protein IMY05_016G0084200 [Salix suchowensis]|nr:hypothetical protein IMY05_016G0084200 [Salix suchowensis]
MRIKPLTVVTSTPKKRGRKQCFHRSYSSLSRPPPLQPVLGLLIALSLIEMWSSHDDE